MSTLLLPDSGDARVFGLDVVRESSDVRALINRVSADPSFFRNMSAVENLQQQKIAVARSFLTSPVVMLLDEPTTGLDPRSKRDVQAFIRQVQSEHDSTILLTTHDMEEAELLCDRIGFIAGGRIVAEGTVLELREEDEDPAEEAVLAAT
jgi:ABC-2 type transport system ATP-binding protein